jgi:hypothetical protein
MKIIYSIIAVFLVIIALSVCGCSSTTTIIQQAPTLTSSTQDTSTIPPPSEIRILRQSASDLTVDYTQQLTALASWPDGSQVDATNLGTWFSSNNNVAAFNSSGGLVNGVNPGVASITVEFMGIISAPITLTVISAPITTVPPVSTTTLWTVQDQIFKPSTYDTAPPNGIYAQPGETLTFSWSADGGLVGYIFTVNQYNNWKNNILGLPSSYAGYNSGSTGSITVTIQNSDTYYAVLFNNALGILGSGPNVEVYQAALTER